MQRPVLSVLFLLLLAGTGSCKRNDIRIGAKIFPESQILQSVAGQVLGADRAGVVTGPPMDGTAVLWRALLDGDIDVYPEYTGTITEQIFAGLGPLDDRQLRAELGKRGIGMTRSLGFNDTYAIGMNGATADRLGVKSIGDLAKHPGLRIAFSNEFMLRHDGWPGVRAAYGLSDDGVKGVAHDLAYRALFTDTIDVTDLYSTDAEIAAHHLRVLVDDRHFFPEYDAVYLYRLDLEKRSPGSVARLERVEGKIDADSIRAMNARAKIDGVPAAVVARDFVAKAFGIDTTVRVRTRSQDLLLYTGQHLRLVGISLFAAIVVAIPLGIAAAEKPRLGQVVTATAAAIYTIPSLALLVFMIPIFKTGVLPAVVALFLYSLLPIIRGTQTGLQGIPGPLRESAEVLGLSFWTRLFRIDLPLAMPSLMAGLKTAAVLNIGTATLGGFIGAGGYGEPIFSGITLGDQKLILLGAIPAAVMALAAQWGFELVQWAMTPKRLRLRRRTPQTT